MIEHVAVLIPARDEAERIAACLHAVTVAGSRCRSPVSITVVADNCTDDTALIARAFAGVRVIEIDSGNVGVARRSAAERALVRLPLDPGTVWLAHTDADSIVPSGWLASQIRHADNGYDLVIGSVRPNPRELSAAQLEAWRRSRAAGGHRGDVHGANLGVRASAYLAVGGYRPLVEHEDVDLVARLSAHPQIAPDDEAVVTSARLDGRTPGGFAGYLRRQISETSR